MKRETIEVEMDTNKWVEKFGANIRPGVFMQNMVYRMEAIMKRILEENPDRTWKNEEELIEVTVKTAEIMDKENKERYERAKNKAEKVGGVLKKHKAKKPLDF